MKEQNEFILNKTDYTAEEWNEISREKDPEKRNQLAMNILKFKDVSRAAEAKDKADEQLNQHATVNSGFHDYEQSSFMTKRKLSDLCVLYRVFFETNPQYRAFLNQVKEYADLDPYSTLNYEKEVKLVKKIPEQIALMEKLLDKEENDFYEEYNRTIQDEKYKDASEEEKAIINRRLLIKEETIDNRRRALASFSNYFDNMTRGDMSDLIVENVDDEYVYKNEFVNLNMTINEFNKRTGHTVPQHMKIENISENGKYGKIWYINAAGVKLDASFDLSKDSSIDKDQRAEYNEEMTEWDRSDEPIFPHEPRMTDISQASTGDCYLLAGLQNVARLYPQKIRNMIIDNGDGTATVRFFSRQKIDGNIVYNPVYVRVDKKIPRIGSDTDRMSSDCLWVNLIEKAYAMSGLHESYNQTSNVPIDPSKPKHKNWKPKLSSIEGGREEAFLENILGKEGMKTSLIVPPLGDNKSNFPSDPQEREKYLQNLLKDVDVNNPESVIKHAFYQVYEAMDGKIPKEVFMKSTQDQIINLCAERLENHFKGSEPIDRKLSGRILKTLYSSAKNSVESLIEKKQKKNISANDILKHENKRDFYFRQWLTADGAIKLSRHAEIFAGVISTFHLGILEANDIDRVMDYKFKGEDLYNNIHNAIDKGKLVSFGTVKHGNTKYMDGQHAYSIIGAYMTEDVPPKRIFRVKNPHTKSFYENGLAYSDKNGQFIGKWVNVKDGIFDITLEDFSRDCKIVFVNGNKTLEDTPHMKTEGYDVITNGDIKEFDKSQITADKLTDYVKVANDLYDAMVSTNSAFSKDSPEYKALLDGIKDFRHDLSLSLGHDKKDLKKLTEPLMNLVEVYESHVKSKGNPSSRQAKRKSVCEGIRFMSDCLNKGINPQQAAEKEYADKLVEKFYSSNKMKLPDNIEQIKTRMYNNKAFRTIANSTNIQQLKKPSVKQMKRHLSNIQSNLKGRGLDKDVNMATMSRENKNPQGAVKAKQNKTVPKAKGM